MGENIDIKIREDGSRVVSRNLDDIANSADKADKSVKDVNKTLGETAKTSSGLDRLRKALDQTNISLQQAFDSSRVERFNQGLVQYRNGLMKHFEMIAKGARASTAAIKSQMDAMTTKTPALSALAEYYGEQEKAHVDSVNASAKYLAEQEAMERASSVRRLGIIVENMAERRAIEESYGAFWKKELDARDKLEQQAVASTVRSMKVQEEAESRSNQQRLKYASQAIAERMKAESAYTTWWITEMKKRDAATAANNLNSAQQRSGMQTVNAERLDRQLVKGVNPQSAFYSASESGNGAKTALQTAEVQAMQRQMAMMQLLAPMAQRQLDIDKESELVTRRQVSAKDTLTSTHGKLAASSNSASINQRQWNEQAREAHALARGLSGSLGQLWLTYGSILPLLAGAALGSAFVGAAKAGSELAYQLTFVKALGGETEVAISRLSNQAHELGTKGVNGPRELASGYRVLSQAGKNAAESLAIMPDVLNLATVGELKMEEAGLAIVGTMNAFRLQTEDSTRVSDLFAKAAAVSQSSVQDLTQSMRYASTTSTMYKQNLEDTMTALTLLARVNITGTSAGTAYRNMLKEIYTPTEKAKKSWQELGVKMVEVVDGKEQIRGFVDIMYDLQKVMSDPKKGYTEKGQLNIIGELFGERGSKEAAEMLTIVKGKWIELRDELANSKGFGQKVTDAVNATAKNQWVATLNTLESSLAKSFDKMENGFVGFMSKLKEIFASEDFRSSLDSLVQGVVTFGNAFLQATPYLLEFAKAWLVLKAAQVGANIGQLLLAAATGAQTLAGGMLAASGAMGPVARGASMLAPLLSALGGPLSLILGLLLAGAAAWALWGQKAETASGKAIKSSEERLKELEKKKKFGSGELADSLAELEVRETRLNHMIAAGAKGDNLSEARKSVEMQQTIVDLLQEQEYAQKNLAAAEAKRALATASNVPGFGPNGWDHPTTKKGGNSGPSGRLNKDDNALATLKARLEASQQEYEEIQKYGQARFELNEGQKKALEIQEKITALEKMSTSELLEKGIKGREAQLTSLKEQFTVATKLGEQFKINTLARVDTSLQEESRLVSLLPEKRDEENKFLAFRNQLLKEGIPLVEIDLDKLREKVANQAELNRLMAVRDNVVSGSSMETLKNTDRDARGILEATKIPGITEGDKNAATMAKMSALGLDMSQTTEFISAQEQQFATLNAQVDLFYQNRLIGEETFRMAKAQIQLKYEQIELNQASQFFGGLATLANSGNRKLAAVGKAAAVTEATINGYVQVSKALASSAPPMNYALAAAAAVSSAMQVSKILGVNTAFATGGSFVVGGSGGVDSQQVSMRASPGERVTVSTPTQVRKGDELNKGKQSNNSSNNGSGGVKIVNVIDPNLLHDYLSSAAGERVLINTLQRNTSALRGIVNG